MADYRQNGVSIFDLAEGYVSYKRGMISSFSPNYQMFGVNINGDSSSYRMKARPPVSFYAWSRGVPADYYDSNGIISNQVCAKGCYPCNTKIYSMYSGEGTMEKNSSGNIVVADVVITAAAADDIRKVIVELQGAGGGSGGSNGSNSSSGGAGGAACLVVADFDKRRSFYLDVGYGGSGGAAGSAGGCTDGIYGVGTSIRTANGNDIRVTAGGGKGGPSAWNGGTAAGGVITDNQGAANGIYLYGYLTGGNGAPRTSPGSSGESSSWTNISSPSFGIPRTNFAIASHSGGSGSGGTVGGGGSGLANGGNANSKGSSGAGAGGRSEKAGIFNPGNDGMRGGNGSITFYY